MHIILYSKLNLFIVFLVFTLIFVAYRVTLNIGFPVYRLRVPESTVDYHYRHPEQNMGAILIQNINHRFSSAAKKRLNLLARQTKTTTWSGVKRMVCGTLEI